MGKYASCVVLLESPCGRHLKGRKIFFCRSWYWQVIIFGIPKGFKDSRDIISRHLMGQEGSTQPY